MLTASTTYPNFLLGDIAFSARLTSCSKARALLTFNPNVDMGLKRRVLLIKPTYTKTIHNENN